MGKRKTTLEFIKEAQFIYNKFNKLTESCSSELYTEDIFKQKIDGKLYE